MKIVEPEEHNIAGELTIPRDRAAAKLSQQIEKSKRLPLITVHGPAGVGKSDLAGPVLCQKLRGKSGKKALPHLFRVEITEESSAIDLAIEVCDIIIENHSEFKSRKSATVFREKMERSIRRSPSEAAERLRSMMRSTEKAKFDPKKIQLVICLDNVDKLFEKRVKDGSDLSKTAICGGASDPIGFVRRLVGMKSILFTVVYRSWVARDVNEILSTGGVLDTRRININLPYPDPDEVDRVVKKMLAPFKNDEDTSSKEFNDLLEDLISTVTKNPASVAALPDILKKLFFDSSGKQKTDRIALEEFLTSEGLAGHLSKAADSLFLKQNTSGKLALEEVFSKLLDGDGRLLLHDVAMAEELWSAAMSAVEARILAIDGPSYHKARFVPIHSDLLTSWSRAVDWSESERIVGLTQLNELNDIALSWELSDRHRALLLQDDQLMDDARKILRDSELSQQVAPLTREFLHKSLRVRAGKDARSLLKKAIKPVGAGVSGIIMLCIIGVIYILATSEDKDETVAETNTTEVPETTPENSGEAELLAGVLETELDAPAENVEAEDPANFRRLTERDRLLIDPVPTDLLASAKRLSESVEAIPEEVALLPPLDLIPQIEESIDLAAMESATADESSDSGAPEKPAVSETPSENDQVVQIDPDELKDLKTIAGRNSDVPIVLPASNSILETGKEKDNQPETSPRKKMMSVDRHSKEGIIKKVSIAIDAFNEQEAQNSKNEPGLAEGKKKTEPSKIAKTTKPKIKSSSKPKSRRGRMEVVTVDSSWRQILNAMGAGIAGDDSDMMLDALTQFHEKTILFPDEIRNIQVSEFKDLTSHLGKIALMQKDRVAMQSAWNLELVSQNVVELSTSLRMLMARIAMNAGREEDAVAYLAQTKIQSKINPESIAFMKAAIGFHFNESSKASESFRKLLPPQASADIRKK